MVDVLWQAGQTAAAIRLEMLWNQFADAFICSSLRLFDRSSNLDFSDVQRPVP